MVSLNLVSHLLHAMIDCELASGSAELLVQTPKYQALMFTPSALQMMPFVFPQTVFLHIERTDEGHEGEFYSKLVTHLKSENSTLKKNEAGIFHLEV